MKRKMLVRPPARLALENGAVFYGRAFGASDASATSAGEVVFNTAMTGYQEALTDPSYSGQILTMTAPMVGNYGVALQDVESAKPQVSAFVIRELSRVASNYRAADELSAWLAAAGIPGIEGVDTRALVRILRSGGAMRGVVSSDASRTNSDLVQLARHSPQMTGRNLACVVSPSKVSEWTEDLGAWDGSSRFDADGRSSFHVVSLDCGAKRNIYRHLVERGCRVTVVPFDTPPERILEMKPDGLFVSNGPGDPDAVEVTIETLRQIAGRIPTFGICLGHQLLALAAGASTYKLKFGHRGANQPVRNRLTGRVEITSQNHGFCVDTETLNPQDFEVTHVHLNDGTLAGFRHRSKPIFCVQYHPEASPGPHDSAYLFDGFLEMMRTRRPASTAVVPGNVDSPA